jgi:hypothetical protein
MLTALTTTVDQSLEIVAVLINKRDLFLFHCKNKAIGPHINPILFDVGQASGPGIRAVLGEPTRGNFYEVRPKRILALIITEHTKRSDFVIKWIGRHAVIHRERSCVVKDATNSNVRLTRIKNQNNAIERRAAARGGSAGARLKA